MDLLSDFNINDYRNRVHDLCNYSSWCKKKNTAYTDAEINEKAYADTFLDFFDDVKPHATG